MSRHFCLIDTRDTLPGRVVINIQTRNNVEQAIAENINPNMSHAERVEQAKKPSSDYMYRVWVRHYNPDYELEIHVESSELLYNGQLIKNQAEWLKVQPRGWTEEHPTCGPTQKHLHVDLGHIKYVHRRYHISPGKPVEHHLNTHVKSAYVKLSPNIFIQTHSKSCAFKFITQHKQCTWSKWTGCQIDQSDDNKRDHLKHVLDL